MNKLILIGNVGRDPEMKYTPSGQAVTSFSVASNHNYTDSAGQKKSETEWFNCSAWGKLAEITNEHLHKGSQVYIEGRLKSRTYETQNGETRFSNDVTISQVQFLGGRSDGQRSSGSGAEEDPVSSPGQAMDTYDGADDLPF